MTAGAAKVERRIVRIPPWPYSPYYLYRGELSHGRAAGPLPEGMRAFLWDGTGLYELEMDRWRHGCVLRPDEAGFRGPRLHDLARYLPSGPVRWSSGPLTMFRWLKPRYKADPGGWSWLALIGRTVALLEPIDRTEEYEPRGYKRSWLRGRVPQELRAWYEGKPEEVFLRALARLALKSSNRATLEKHLWPRKMTPEAAERLEQLVLKWGEPVPAETESAIRAFLEEVDVDLQTAEMPASPLDAARRLLVERLPFFGHAAFELVFVPEGRTGTASVDRWGRLYYNPAWLQALSVERAAAVLYHELGHVLRLHFKRGEALGADPVLWNLACDLEINDDIPEPFVLPRGAVVPWQFGLPRGLTAEEYLELLSASYGPRMVSRAAAAGWDPCGSGAGGNPARWERAEPGSAATRRHGPADAAPAEGRGPDPACDADGRPGHTGGGGAGGEGTAEGCQTADWGVRGLSQAEIEGLVERTIEQAKRLADAARRGRWGPSTEPVWGEIPGSWARWFDRWVRSRVDWRRELAGAIRGALSRASGMVDYTYSRPSRRAQAVAPVILPALAAPQPEAAIVVDTSGSMTSELLAAAMSEVEAILRANGRAASTVYAVDAAVQTVSRVTRASVVRLQGGGGTDMGAGIEAAARGRPRPDLIIVLTDGYTPWPAAAPGVPVVVGVLGGLARDRFASRPETPAWARTVRIPVDEEPVG